MNMKAYPGLNSHIPSISFEQNSLSEKTGNWKRILIAASRIINEVQSADFTKLLKSYSDSKFKSEVILQ